MQKKHIILLVIVINLSKSFCKTYDNYTLYEAIPLNEEQLYFFNSLHQDQSTDVMFWADPGRVNRTVNVMVSREYQKLFLRKANQVGIVVTKVISNVQEAFNKQKVKYYVRRNMKTFNWINYSKLEDIYSWLQDMAVKFSDRMQLVSAGKSAEGREILGVYLKCKSKMRCKNIFIEGGIHAREWIGHTFVTYLINQLVHANEINTKEINYAMYKYNWHIFPVVNPDGYVYSHDEDRMWRKNRNKSQKGAIGVDLNRNFDYKFSTVGISNNPHEEIYCGPEAFSEPESKAIRNYVSTIGNNLAYYISFHSYGQYFIIPYANAQHHKDNFEDVKKLAKRSLDKLKSISNTKYIVGTAYDTVGYTVSGNSVDWAKKKFNIPVAVNIELRDDGKYGFALPSKYILPTCIETMAMCLDLIQPLKSQIHSSKSIDKQDESPSENNAGSNDNTGVFVFIAGFFIKNMA